MKRTTRLYSCIMAIVLSLSMIVALGISVAAEDTVTVGQTFSPTVPTSAVDSLDDSPFSYGVAYRPSTGVTDFASAVSLDNVKMVTKITNGGNQWGAGTLAYKLADDGVAYSYDPTFNNGQGRWSMITGPGEVQFMAFTAPACGTYTYSLDITFNDNNAVFVSVNDGAFELKYNAANQNVNDGNIHTVTATVSLEKGDVIRIGCSRTYCPNGYEQDRISIKVTALTFTYTKADHDFAEGTCSACGAADPDYVAPSVPSTPTNPTTSDAIVGIAVTAIISLAAMTVIYVRKRR